MLSLPFYSQADINQAVDYLKKQPQDAWTTQALLALGEDDLDLDHIKSVNGQLATDYAKIILATVAAGKNPHTFGNIDYLKKLKTYYQDGQMGEKDLINDDFWSLLAFHSANQNDTQMLHNIQDYILSHQNNDGGWGYQVGGASDSNDTAAAIMALLESGVSVQSQAIQNAFDYLASLQNSDGGFPFSQAGDSDSGSTAWVVLALNKAEYDLSSWSQNQSPIDFINSLQDADGGFWWVDPESDPNFNNKAMSSFASLALSSQTLPLDYFEDSHNLDIHLRIEGPSQTICEIELSEADTALSAIEQAANECGYNYTIEKTDFGPYLSSIKNHTASGNTGWMYFVNFNSPSVGAADYSLNSDDKLLWYFGEWGWQPTRLRADKTTLKINQPVTLTAEYYQDGSWQNFNQAEIMLDEDLKTTDNLGQLQLSFDQNGLHRAYLDMPGYVRSNQVTLHIGSLSSEPINLQAEVIISQNGDVAGDSIALLVNKSHINFGQLSSGDIATASIELSNQSSNQVTLSATLNGDDLFKNNLTINTHPWASFGDELPALQSQDYILSLQVPTSYLVSGVKSANLIFWAEK